MASTPRSSRGQRCRRQTAMAHTVMAYTVMVYMCVAYPVMAHVVMTYIITDHRFMAYAVMAPYSYGIYSYGAVYSQCAPALVACTPASRILSLPACLLVSITASPPLRLRSRDHRPPVHPYVSMQSTLVRKRTCMSVHWHITAARLQVRRRLAACELMHPVHGCTGTHLDR